MIMKIKMVHIGSIILLCSLFALCCNKSPVTPDLQETGNLKTPATEGTVWAASSAPFIGETLGGVESWQRLNNRLKAANGGFGMMGRRSYDKGIPATFAASAMAEDVGNCPVSIGSFKPDWTETVNGSNNEAIKKFIQSIPDDRVVYLVFYHEPEDNVNSRNTSDVLLQAFARFVNMVLTSGKTNIHPCFVLMTWTFKPQSGRNPEDFNMGKYLKPEQLSKVVAGLDGYADDPSVSAQQIFEANVNRMKTWGFTRFGIFETGAHASPTDASARSKWVEGLGQWVKSRNDIELVSWFNNGNGQHAGPTGWYLGNWYKNGTTYSWDDADGTIAAFAQLLKQN
ncbi:MAG: hypothetical protein RBS73_12885 [Prolixibacteraceae bacterium]|jgi:hypothetical protein|nr:hypothetical protein [Prolixibacteraceae bacterium]